MPCVWVGGCICVKERMPQVMMSFGKYTATLSEAGCYCANPCGRQMILVSSATQTIHIERVKIADYNGNPLVISAVVTFKITEPVKAALDVPNSSDYIKNQALTVMKRCASMYPYEAANGPSLKSEAEHVREMMVSLLQQKAQIAGASIISFDLSDLSYAPEVAQQLLVRQQAEATLAARTIIAKGAVSISTTAVDQVAAGGVEFTREEKARLVSNLLITICGDSRPVSTIQMSSSQ